MPETAPAGQLPRSIDVLLDNDLVDSCKVLFFLVFTFPIKAGDRIQVIGQFRCLPGKKNGYTSGSFRTAVIANNVQLFNQQLEPTFSDKDIGVMRLITKRHVILPFTLVPYLLVAFYRILSIFLLVLWPPLFMVIATLNELFFIYSWVVWRGYYPTVHVLEVMLTCFFWVILRLPSPNSFASSFMLLTWPSRPLVAAPLELV